MSRKQAIHLINTNAFGIKDKIKNFIKPKTKPKKKGL
jgi:hypothetical protein